MKAIETHIPRISGAYEIRCMPEDKPYVGGATNIHRRWLVHRRALNQGVHCNTALQAAWDRYSEFAFVVSVLELASPDMLDQVEQRWIDRFDSSTPEHGYNQLAKAKRAIGFTIPQEKVQRRRQKLLKVYEGFIDPEGNEVGPITDLKAFCAERGLHPGAMASLSYPGTPNREHQGWSHRTRLRDQDPFPSHAQRWEGFIDPNGNEVVIQNLAQFCREHGLSHDVMERIAKGPSYKFPVCRHKGWTHKSWIGHMKRKKANHARGI